MLKQINYRNKLKVYAPAYLLLGLAMGVGATEPPSDERPPAVTSVEQAKRQAARLSAVKVTATRLKHEYFNASSSAGTKINTSLLETPQSISIVTRAQMDLWQAGTTSQALRYTAGANSEKYGAVGDQLDLTRVRGIDADYFLDGLRVIGNASTWAPQIDAYSLESVEVLRGPASYLYGQGSGGGIVNQVSRRPQGARAHEISLRVGSFGQRFIGIDSTGPVNHRGSLLYRFTASGLASSAQIEQVRHKRLYLAPAVTWRPTSHLSWTILLTHSREPEIPNYNSLPADLLGLNHSVYPQINRRRNYRDMRFDDSSRRQNSISSIFQYQWTPQWSFHSGMRYMDISSNLVRSSVYGYQLVQGRPMLRNTYELAPSGSHTFSTDNYVHGHLQLGSSRHDLLLGADYANGSLNNSLYSDGSYLTDPYGPHYRPSIIPDFTASMASPWSDHQHLQRYGFYLQDQVAYRHWRLTLGGRYDISNTQSSNQSYSPVRIENQMDNHRWTGRIGLSYLFDAGLAPYASYATSIDPLLGSGYDGKAFLPIDTRQYEVGIKFHPPQSNTLLTAALFQLEQSNVRTADSIHLGFNTQAGKVRTRGLDLAANAQPLPNFDLSASYTYLNNILIQDTVYRGNSLTQTPRHSASIWLSYRQPRGPLSGLQVGVGARYLGATEGDPANTFQVPAATLLDLVVNYELGGITPALGNATLALNVGNLGNRRYIASCTSLMYCFIGQNRNFSATFSYRW